MAGIISGLLLFLRALPTVLLIFIAIGVFLILTGLSMYIWAVIKRRKTTIGTVQHIPTILTQMQKKVNQLIETAKPPEQDKVLVWLDDLGELLDIDMKHVAEKLHSTDNKEARDTFSGIVDKARGAIEPESPHEQVVMFLLKLGGSMDSNGLGLSIIKDQQYMALEQRLEELRIGVQSPETSKKINTYLMWSYGLDSLSLFLKHAAAPSMQEHLQRILTAEARAWLPLIPSLFGMFRSNLLAEISESISNEQKNK